MRGMNARWGHVVTAMATPFAENGDICLDTTRRLAAWLTENGSSALVVNGTTGESPTTSPAEKVALVRAVVEVLGSDKVIAGVGGYNTAEVLEAAHAAKAAGAGALLAVVPYYNKPSQEGLYRHFRALAETTDLPVMLYNVPGRTITNLEASTVARLVADCPTVVGIKEASANLGQIAEIIRTTPDTFDVYSGDDATCLPQLALGGAGIVSVISHAVGRDLAEVHRAWFAGEREKAAAAFLPTLPVYKALFSAPSPAPVKFALRALGLPVGGVRLPLVDVNESEAAAIHAVLKEYGLPV
jgi:4-hydroxy-tetrahydrodipicolinate synthase